MTARARLLALVVGALVSAPAGAATCAELTAKVAALKTEIAQLEREAGSGDARLVEVQGALGALFADRREMKQATDRARWDVAARRVTLTLQLLMGTMEEHHLTRPQGDPQRPVDDAVNAVVNGGILTLTGGGAARVDALAAQAARRLQPGIYLAAANALRAHLALLDEAAARGFGSTGPLPDPLQGEKLARRYADTDAVFEDPGAAPLRAFASTLDESLATLQLASEQARRPSEAVRLTLDQRNQELAKTQAALASCTGK